MTAALVIVFYQDRILKVWRPLCLTSQVWIYGLLINNLEHEDGKVNINYNLLLKRGYLHLVTFDPSSSF